MSKKIKGDHKINDAIDWVRDALPDGYDVEYDFALDTVAIRFFRGDEEVAYGCEYADSENIQERILNECNGMANRAGIVLEFPEDQISYWRSAGLNRGQP